MDITQTRVAAEESMNRNYAVPSGELLTELLLKHVEDVQLRNALLTLLVLGVRQSGGEKSVAYYIGALCDLIELRKYAPAQPVGEDS